jgi:hypothetical protein
MSPLHHSLNIILIPPTEVFSPNTTIRDTNRYFGTYTSRQSPLGSSLVSRNSSGRELFPGKVAFLEPVRDDGDSFTGTWGFLEPAEDDEDFFVEVGDLFTVAASFFGSNRSSS